MTRRDTETAAGFLAARRDWLHVETVDRANGGYDVVLRIDGTYYHDIADRRELVDYFTRWLADVLANEGIDREAAS